MLSRGTAVDKRSCVKLYSYVVARDFGFAPNPFHGFCTLATCKPTIRNRAQIDDWVVGTGAKVRNRQGYVVFALRVTEVVTYQQYWQDSRFLTKRPNLAGSKKQAFGDNIYHWDPDSECWLQENSHHSYSDGTINSSNVENDTQAPRVLISEDYVYWGGVGPILPPRFRNYSGVDMCAGHGYKSNFPQKLIQEVVEWIRAEGDWGYVGDPLDWARTP